jgi:pimeloyl-ACP methyl ester carboxylesterase
MSTANVARDLDELRKLVGDERLSYAGVSYGSYLGVTYANLFPSRVRALLVDGVPDPIAWSTGRGIEGYLVPFSTRLRSDAGAQATLQEFFRLCDAGGPRCAFSAWSINGALADAQFGYFGRSYCWDSSICAEWPGHDEDRYTGPFNMIALATPGPGATCRQDVVPFAE